MEILIAEDDLTSRHMLESILRKWGHEVVAVEGGLEALRRLSENGGPLLGILDWMMPEMDGPEVCRRLRKAKASSIPYIILLTAKAGKDDIVSGLDAGANDYVTKPFARDELRAWVNVGERIIHLELALVQQVKRLQEALDHIKTLQGILPICMYCHKIQDDKASWRRIEEYLSTHSDAEFSHGICPECLAKFHPEFQEEE